MSETVLSGEVVEGDGRAVDFGAGGLGLHRHLGLRLGPADFGERQGHLIHEGRVTADLDLRALDLQDRRFGYPLEMVTRAVAAGWRVVEVDVDYLPRTGRSKVTGTVGGTLKAVRDMSRVLREIP